MSKNRLIHSVSDSIESLENDFILFRNNPDEFNKYAGEQIAYKLIYNGRESVKYESSIVYFKYKCKEVINNINTCKLLISSNVITGEMSKESLEMYNQLLDSDIDEIISLEMKIADSENFGSAEISEVLKNKSDKRRKSGRKSDSTNLLTTAQQALLFYFLAESEAIPGKGNKTAISKFYERITDQGSDNARKAMNFGTSLDEKKVMIEKLKNAIKLIENS